MSINKKIKNIASDTVWILIAVTALVATISGMRYVYMMPTEYVKLIDVPGVGKWYCEYERKTQWGKIEATCTERMSDKVNTQ